MTEIRERPAVMDLPRSRLALWQLMLAIAVLATCLALLRVNIALGVIAACVSCLSIVRTVRIVRGAGAPGGKVSPGRWFHAGLESLVVACWIIGASDITFLLVYGILSSGQGHGLDPVALFVGVAAGIGVSCLVRCWMWDGLAKPEDLG